jgi:hypothetical protein
MYRAPTPEVFRIEPLVESPTTIQYTYDPVAKQSGGLLLSPLKGLRERGRHKRRQTKSTTSTESKKSDLRHQSPHGHSSIQTCGNDGPDTSINVIQADRELVGISTQTEKSLGFIAYLDYVLADCAGFYQISDQLCVVQGWNGGKQRVTVGTTVGLTEFWEINDSW